MKKTAILFLALVMIVSVFCGCTRRNDVIEPTVSPIVTTSPGQDEVLPDDDLVPDAEDGVITDDNVEDGVVTDDKTEVLPAEGDKNEKNTAG